jgi:predicted acyltransferase
MAASVTFSAPPSTATGRVLSVDIARGITIAFMIMVNNNGAHAWHPFTHSLWNGWTPTDLVFPGFLFLVGVSIVLAFGKRFERGVSKGRIVVSILRRTAILVLLGLVVNGYPHFPWATLRFYGVLQRIALCYCCVALFYLWRRDAASKVVAVVVILVGYWVLMRYMPVPGAGVPGKNIPFLDPTQNWAAWLDRHIFPGRLYEGVRDPEGFLSTFPAIATTLLGLLAGLWMRTERPRKQIALGLLAAAVGLVILGKLWGISFPLNKKLWTSSYVLFSAGTSALLLGGLYWMIDVKGRRGAWTLPWIVFGTNAIFAYMLSELLASTLWIQALHHHREMLWTWIYAPIFAHIRPVGLGSLCYSIAFTIVCWLATYPLWRRKIFLKI